MRVYIPFFWTLGRVIFRTQVYGCVPCWSLGPSVEVGHLRVLVCGVVGVEDGPETGEWPFQHPPHPAVL